jgi:TonB-dependent receptor
VTPATKDRSYTNFFPSLQGRYAFADDLIGRLAVSTTIARPTFGQANGNTTIDIGNATINTGNPDLKPMTSINFDAAIEKYLPHAGILSAGLFNKQFSDFIVTSTSRPVIDGTTYTQTSYANAGGGSYARGLELNYEQRYTMLPGVFGGLGTAANYTFVDSRFDIRPGEHSQLPLTSRNTGNLAVFYEKDGLGLRLGAYYVSRNLFQVVAPGLDIFTEDRTTVDFGATYALDKNLSLYANAKNLSNEPLKFTEGSSNRPIQREYYNVTLQAGINLNY